MTGSGVFHRGGGGLLLLQRDRPHWHHGRDRVLVNQLRLTVPAQKNAEIVEPSDVSLKLDAIHQEDGHRRLALTHGIQKSVLKVLLFIAHLCRHTLLPAPSRSES